MKIDFLWASCFVQTQSGFRVSSTQYTLSSEVDLIVVAMTIIIIIITLIFTDTLGYAIMRHKKTANPYYSQGSFKLQNKAKMAESKVRLDQGREVSQPLLADVFQTCP